MHPNHVATGLPVLYDLLRTSVKIPDWYEGSYHNNDQYNQHMATSLVADRGPGRTNPRVTNLGVVRSGRKHVWGLFRFTP